MLIDVGVIVRCDNPMTWWHVFQLRTKLRTASQEDEINRLKSQITELRQTLIQETKDWESERSHLFDQLQKVINQLLYLFIYLFISNCAQKTMKHLVIM